MPRASAGRAAGLGLEAWGPAGIGGAAGSGPERFVVALGYAGWGDGQLEEEMRQNAWLSIPSDIAIVFDLPVPRRFDEALGRLGVRADMLHSEAGHA